MFYYTTKTYPCSFLAFPSRRDGLKSVVAGRHADDTRKRVPGGWEALRAAASSGRKRGTTAFPESTGSDANDLYSAARYRRDQSRSQVALKANATIRIVDRYSVIAQHSIPDGSIDSYLLIPRIDHKRPVPVKLPK